MRRTSVKTGGTPDGLGPARKVGPAPRMSATTRANRDASRARNENVRIVKPINYTR